MGSASATVAGEQQEAPLHLPSLPMENSPPGIHTMPSGAGPVAGVLFGTVGAKADTTAAGGLVALSSAKADALQTSVARPTRTAAWRFRMQMVWGNIK